MRNLDEVITALGYCLKSDEMGNCNGNCPYIHCCDPESNIVKKDALYFLKEYRSEKGHWEADRKGYEDWIERYKDAREKHQQAVIKLKQNPPLSWAELREMEGKPVWIELLNHDMWVDSEWWVIGEVRKDDIILATYLDEMELCEEDIGVLWNAFRKKRE